MHASSLTRIFLTISFRVAIMASRFSFVRSDVSIMIPSDTASVGAAITLGRFGGATGGLAGSVVFGSCKVDSNPADVFVLLMGETVEDFVAGAEATIPLLFLLVPEAPPLEALAEVVPFAGEDGT